MKPVMLLAIALFLLSAPTPDARDLGDISAHFLVLDDGPGLLASEDTGRGPTAAPGVAGRPTLAEVTRASGVPHTAPVDDP